MVQSRENGSDMSSPPPQRLPSCMLAARRLLPQSRNETCSDADYNETVLSIFVREAFDRPNKVAVDANGTTKVSSGKFTWRRLQCLVGSKCGYCLV